MHNNLAIYIHWPFCKSKCPYCDFNSHVKDGINHAEWNAAYLTEISYFADYIKGKTITSIFFGGGTPSLMPPYIAENIINKLESYAKFEDNIEITLEGNPTSVEAAKFIDFKNAGINRVSLGIQSLDDKALKFLGREHSATEALKAIETATIFSNYSFDLIYARPEQTLKEWENELKQALKHTNNHMSLYQLTIEKGTSFYTDHKSGKFKMPEDSLSADFYELTSEIMESNGLPAYEISNHAAPGFESKHNLTYWRYGDYLGIGAGAHSRITEGTQKKALMMIHSPENWLKSVKEKGAGLQNNTTLETREAVEELVMMGLRINEGVNINYFKQISGQEPEKYLKNIDELIDAKIIQLDEDFLRATKQGRLILNSITAKLLE